MYFILEPFVEIILGILVIAFFVWVSVKFLAFLFRKAKQAIGWLGPYIVSILPAAGSYIVTSTLFGAGNWEASVTGFITAAIAGTVLNA